jgi:putative metalloprotease
VSSWNTWISWNGFPENDEFMTRIKMKCVLPLLLRACAIGILSFAVLPRVRAEDCRAAAADSPEARRLAGLTQGGHWQRQGKITFKHRACLNDNYLWTWGSTIGMTKWLMARMEDDEVRCLIAHAMGHVVLGHLGREEIRARLKADSGDEKNVLTEEEADFNRVMEDAAFASRAQGQEREADEFALEFMKKHSRNPAACIGAMEKLARVSGKSNWRDEHPDALGRAEWMREHLDE